MPLLKKAISITKGEKPLTKGWDALMKTWDSTQPRRAQVMDESKTVVLRQFADAALKKPEHFVAVAEDMDLEAYAKWAAEPAFDAMQADSGVSHDAWDLFEMILQGPESMAALPDVIPMMVGVCPLNKGYDAAYAAWIKEQAFRQTWCDESKSIFSFCSDPDLAVLVFFDVQKAAMFEFFGNYRIEKPWADAGFVIEAREFYTAVPVMPVEAPLQMGLAVCPLVKAGQFPAWKKGFNAHKSVRAQYCDESKTMCFTDKEEKTAFIYFEKLRMSAMGKEVFATPEFQKLSVDLGEDQTPGCGKAFYSLEKLPTPSDGLFDFMCAPALPEKIDLCALAPVKKGVAHWFDGFWNHAKARAPVCDESKTVAGFKKNRDVVLPMLFDFQTSKMAEMAEFQKVAAELGEDLANKKVYRMVKLQ